ncbi:MAG: Ig-like domain-containing protein [Flavobacteriales bacterium]|nr:Ig-like domain-containing protein [Flavobacteriales bacterium]
MNKRKTLVYGAYLFMMIGMYACASVGSPTGGYTDRIPPVPLMYSPENGTTSFSEKKITILFNERIKFNDLHKNLIVSPHLDIVEHIKPTAAMPSKELTIDLSKVKLEPNTTYTINFGNSIADFNENNPLPNFKYVFSTGKDIDSLVLGGVVEDAMGDKFSPKTSILLYRVDSTFTDSTVFKERPLYLTNLSEKDSSFRIDNITPGKYMLYAIVDEGGDMKYDPTKDQIAFFPRPIVLDSTSMGDKGYLLRTAMGARPYKIYSPANVQKGCIRVALDGFTENHTIERILPALPEGEKDIFLYSENRDTLSYWSSAEEKDSIVFYVKKDGEVTDTINAKIRKASNPDFVIRMAGNSIHIYDNINVRATKPISSVNPSAISLIDGKDSTAVPFEVKVDSTMLSADIVFEQKPGAKYELKILPEAFTSILGETPKDTLSRNIATKTRDDYGDLRINPISFDKYPMIFQLMNSSRTEVVREKVLLEAGSVTFDILPPGSYYVRIIFDTNSNGKWDTVDVLRHIQPERVKYMNDPIEIRAMWSEDIDW